MPLGAYSLFLRGGRRGLSIFQVPIKALSCFLQGVVKLPVSTAFQSFFFVQIIIMVSSLNTLYSCNATFTRYSNVLPANRGCLGSQIDAKILQSLTFALSQ